MLTLKRNVWRKLLQFHMLDDFNNNANKKENYLRELEHLADFYRMINQLNRSNI